MKDKIKKIWSQEERQNRQFDNLMHPDGKSCSNCIWSDYDDVGDEFTTCGYHSENFSINSFCGCWTSRDDSKAMEFLSQTK